VNESRIALPAGSRFLRVECTGGWPRVRFRSGAKQTHQCLSSGEVWAVRGQPSEHEDANRAFACRAWQALRQQGRLGLVADSRAHPRGYDQGVSATQHVEWHERIRAILDAEITNPDFVLWILVAMEPDASVDDDALLRNVGAWLEGLDVKGVFEARDEPTHIYEDQGLVIRFTAVPRAPAARGLEIPTVGNAVAPEVHGTRVSRSDTGAPTRAHGLLGEPPSPS
jgi:hypothetical protein